MLDTVTFPLMKDDKASISANAGIVVMAIIINSPKIVAIVIE